MISIEEMREVMDSYDDELRVWKTGLMIREAEDPTSPEARDNCKWCKGTGEAHICLMDDCPGKTYEECLHPRPTEEKALAFIRARALSSLRGIKKQMIEEYDQIRTPKVKYVFSAKDSN